MGKYVHTGTRPFWQCKLAFSLSTSFLSFLSLWLFWFSFFFPPQTHYVFSVTKFFHACKLHIFVFENAMRTLYAFDLFSFYFANLTSLESTVYASFIQLIMMLLNAIQFRIRLKLWWIEPQNWHFIANKLAWNVFRIKWVNQKILNCIRNYCSLCSCSYSGDNCYL